MTRDWIRGGLYVLRPGNAGGMDRMTGSHMGIAM